MQVDGARAGARDQAQRGGAPAAALLLRQAIARIDALEGFVRNDGSPLAELREQIEDEAANYEASANNQERVHQDKAARTYRMSVTAQAAARPPPGPAAFLLAAGGPLGGQRIRVLADMTLGRGSSNDVCVPSGNLSRRHTRVVFTNGKYVLQDLGSTNGSKVNGVLVGTKILTDGDRIQLGDQELLFSLDLPDKPTR